MASEEEEQKDITLVVGRDARISGKIVSNLASSTLQSLGINVIDLGLSTTPTVEVMVPELNADGGIIFTASHNPKEWNALKLLNEKESSSMLRMEQTFWTLQRKKLLNILT